MVREENETPNDRNDRGMSSSCMSCFGAESICLGIRKAAAWYSSHLQLNNPPVRGKAAAKLPTVVLLTEDAANRQKAEKEGLATLSGM